MSGVAALVPKKAASSPSVSKQGTLSPIGLKLGSISWPRMLLPSLEHCFGALPLVEYPEHCLDRYSSVQSTIRHAIRAILRGLTAWNVSHLVKSRSLPFSINS
jgi:hypothetical protein